MSRQAIVKLLAVALVCSSGAVLMPSSMAPSRGGGGIATAPALAQTTPPAIGLVPLASGLNNALAVVDAGDASGRLFIVLQGGQILIFDGARVLPQAFLDISALVSCCGEQGLLGLAFHPDYATNGRFFVNYTNRAGDTVIARLVVSAGDPNVANPLSLAMVLRVDQPFSNHNGGQLQFGPDGYLYIALGDGGSSGDPMNNGQRLGTLLGKILRVDVDREPRDVARDVVRRYTSPPDNPFVGVPGARPEIWAYGFRNPWRFAFDRLTGDLFIGDVGQGQWEEIDFQPASSAGGENYGWRRMEGAHCFNPPTGCNPGGLVLPILEYDHSLGCAVIGGFRYRGAQIPDLYARYVYADFCSGRIWGAAQDQAGVWFTDVLLDAPFSVSSFGEDSTGELYVLSYAASGTLYRIATAGAGNTALSRRRSAR